MAQTTPTLPPLMSAIPARPTAALPAVTPAPVIDWSRAWAEGESAGTPEKAAWLKPSVLDFAEIDPNLGLEVVV
jgi:hypothetical protein